MGHQRTLRVVGETRDDDALVLMARSGNDEALRELLDRYKGLVRGRVRRFFLPGAEKDDLLQEGMIGLYQAITGFEPCGAAFRTFAVLCIDRRLFSAVTHANRRKHQPLNTAVYIAQAGSESWELASDRADPSVVVAEDDERSRIRKAFSCLTTFEAQVLAEFLEGRTYREIAANLGHATKSVDNALCRVRDKLKRHLARR